MTWTESEIDFGSTPVYDATFTIATAGTITPLLVVTSAAAGDKFAINASFWTT